MAGVQNLHVHGSELVNSRQWWLIWLVLGDQFQSMYISQQESTKDLWDCEWTATGSDK